jgi:2-polyprenyl-3-methyl-5-hydroxy-6-metoxy-1,4-benzoquinol methylase
MHPIPGDSRQDMDEAKLRSTQRLINGYSQGAFISAMVYAGDALGLYAAMHGAGPLSSEKLAAKTGLNERFLREWLRGQAAAGIIDNAGDETFELSPESGLLLAEEDDLRSMARGFDGLPQRMALMANLPEVFRTGIGLSWSNTNEDRVRWMERQFRAWYQQVLVPVVLPLLDGVVATLEAGAKAADIGCGSGVALVTMATAFPRSEFHGWDIAPLALERAEANAKAAGVTNVTFHDVRAGGIPGDHSFSLVSTFDCVHDMTNPDGLAAALHAALAPDGHWLIADIDGRPSFEENLSHPAAAVMYAMSVAGCLQSGMSEPGGAGLGTLGLPEPAMRTLTERAGFTRFRRLDLQSPVNAYYEARP